MRSINGMTGEGGVHNQLTKEEYNTECDSQFLIDLFCDVFFGGIPKPELRYINTTQNGNMRGHCSSSGVNGVIFLSHDVAGLVLHELAHCVVWNSYKATGHCQLFYTTLQSMIDQWRECWRYI